MESSEVSHDVQPSEADEIAIPPRQLRILLAEDHVIMREGTRELLERHADLVVVAEAGDGEEAVRATERTRPDVVIMDIAMPILNGIEATKRIKKNWPTTAVLVLSAYDDDQYVFALLQAGAAGYLLKNVRGQQVVEAVRAVHNGESVLHPTVAKKAAQRMYPAVAKPVETKGVDRLSDRELEVLRLGAKGLSNKEIAHRLTISIRTVQVHFANIFAKLLVGSRTEAVLEGLRRGWISLEETIDFGE